jgi:adenylylsulfate kinase-like enzyme
MSENNKLTSPATQGKYDHLATELAERLEAEFSLLYVLGGKHGNGLCVQHTYTDAEKPEKMRRLATMFDFLADWARREAGDVAAH